MLQGARVIELDEGDLDSYYTYELTSSFLATQSGSNIADGGVRSETSYSFSNIMLPIFDIIMDIFRDVVKVFLNTTPEIV